jgi:hypothetical protein
MRYGALQALIAPADQLDNHYHGNGGKDQQSRRGQDSRAQLLAHDPWKQAGWAYRLPNRRR